MSSLYKAHWIDSRSQLLSGIHLKFRANYFGTLNLDITEVALQGLPKFN